MDAVSLAIALKAAGKTAEQVKAALDEYLEENPEALDQAAVEAIVGEALASQGAKLDNIENAVADLEAGSLSALGASAGQVPTANGQGSWTWDTTHQVSGANPAIVALAGHRYVCGEVETISITPPASGICDVVFTSGTTPAVLTVPNTVKWPDWFNPANLETSAIYEINIMDSVYGAVGIWT